MEYTCEVKLGIDAQLKLFALKTVQGPSATDSSEHKEHFDVNALQFISTEEFEGEALQLYTDLLIQKLPESRTGSKLIKTDCDAANESGFEFFMMK